MSDNLDNPIESTGTTGTETNQPAQTGEPTTDINVSGTESRRRNYTLDSNWFSEQITNDSVTIDPSKGIYLDTSDSYYSDPEVREAFKTQFGTDDPEVFNTYYDTLKKDYLNKMDDLYTESRGSAATPINLYSTDGLEAAKLVSNPAWDQMQYDDGRIVIGNRTYDSQYSHREGKTDRVVTEDGTVIFTNSSQGGLFSMPLLDDPRLRNKEGKAPVAFKYQADQMYGSHRGGALVPVYDHENDKYSIASNWDIDDYTKIYRESHMWNGLAKVPLNFLISAIDNSIIETSKDLAYIIHGEDSKNYDYVTTLENMSNTWAGRKMSASDEAQSLASPEGFFTMLADVGMQILAMAAIGKGTSAALGPKKLPFLKAWGVPEAQAQQYGAFLGRAWMTTFAANEVGVQGRSLGMSNEESAFSAFAAVAALWQVNRVFDWVEHGLIQNKIIQKKLKKEIAAELAERSVGPKSPGDLAQTGAGVAKRVIKFLDKQLARISPGAQNRGIGKQILFSSLSETGQESFEFLAEELTKNLSNLIRFYSGDYTDTQDEEFKGYAWIADQGYMVDQFLPGLGMSAIGGLMGGGLARPLMAITGMQGWDPKIDDMMTYAIITGNESAFYSARDQLNKAQAFGDPALSVLKDVDGNFLTIAEANKQVSGSLNQNNYYLNMIESSWNFKVKALEALGLRGAGQDNYAAVLKKTPELIESINRFEVGSVLNDNYNTLSEYIKDENTLSSITEIKDGVVQINDEYRSQMASAETEEDREIATKEREDKIKEVVAPLRKQNTALTNEDIDTIITATQNIYDVLQGKYAEKMFVRTLYLQDKLQPENKRKWANLDGNSEIEAVESILQELKIMADAREGNKKVYDKAYRFQTQNNEILKGDGTFLEKVEKLKPYNGVLYVDKNEFDNFINSVDIKPLKKSLREQVKKMTIEDYATISPILQTYLEDPDQNLGPQAAMTEGIVTKETEDGILLDVEGTLKMHQDDLLKQIDAIETLDDIKSLDIHRAAIFMLEDGPNNDRYKIDSLEFLGELIIDQAFSSIKNPELLDEMRVVQELVNANVKQLSPWDDTNLNHLFADYTQSGNEFNWVPDSNLIADVNALKYEFEESVDEDSNTTTFSKFQDAEALKARLARRLEVLDFMDSIQPNLAAFRQKMTGGKLLSFDRFNEVDSELTRFNRAFDRVLYSPTRAAELIELDRKENEEYQKLLKIDKRYSEDKLQLRIALMTLDQMTSANYSRIALDVAKRDRFKQGITSFKKETEDQISFLLQDILNKTGEDFKAEVDNTPAFQELFKATNVKASELTEDEAAGLMQKIIAARDEVYNKFNTKLKAIETHILSLDPSIVKSKLEIFEGAIYAASVPYSEFIARYKGYVGLNQETEADDNKAIFRYPANFSQLTAAGQAFAFFVNEDTQNTIRSLFQQFGKTITEEVSKEKLEELSPLNTLAIQGKLGSGKTTLVGVMSVKMAVDYLELADKSILTAAATTKQVRKLKSELKRAGLKSAPIELTIGKNAQDNIISYLEKERDGVLDGISTIVIDEATFMEDAEYLKSTSSSNKDIVSSSPQAQSFRDSIAQINANRAETDSTMPLLRVVLMGDSAQNGILINTEKAGRISGSVFQNQFLPQTVYLTEAERSGVRSLNQSLDTINEKIGYMSIDAANKQSLDLNYGYDGNTNDILGVVTLNSFEAFSNGYIEGSDDNLDTILMKKLDENPNYTIGIASDEFKTIEELSEAHPELNAILKDPKYKDSIKFIEEHENVQGDEVDFMIVHLDRKNFPGDFTNPPTQVSPFMQKINTSVGRARFGAVIINESNFKIESEYASEETRTSDENVAKLTQLLKDLQIKSFSNVDILEPGASTLVEPITQEEVEPSEDNVDVDEEEDVEENEDENDDSEDNTQQGSSGDTEIETPEVTKEQKSKEIDWEFSPENTIIEFENNLGFVVPANYNPLDINHRKYILRKAIYQLSGKALPKRTSEKNLIQAYVDLLNEVNSAQVLAADEMWEPFTTIDKIKDSLSDIGLSDIRSYQEAYYQGYQILNTISEQGGNYANEVYGIYFGTALKFNPGNYGIGYRAYILTSEDEEVPLQVDAVTNMTNIPKEEASYIFNGSYGILSTENPLGYSTQSESIMSFDPTETSDEFLFGLDRQAQNMDPDDIDIITVEDTKIERYNNGVRKSLTNILKQDPRWKLSYTTARDQSDVLIEIRDDESIPMESGIRQAASAYLVYLYNNNEIKGFNADEFMNRIDAGEFAAGGPKQAANLMYDLDKRGIISINTETFDAKVKGVNPGPESLAYTAETILKASGFEVASPTEADYLKTTRELVTEDSDKKPTKFITYAYRAFKEDGKTEEYTTMMVAAEYNNKVYVLGHFNNTTNPGPNLAKIQQAAKSAYNVDKGNGKSIIGIWKPGRFKSFLNEKKSLTPGKIIKGKRKTLNQITEMLKDAGLTPGPVKIITTPGKKHSGRAVLFYSSDPNEDFDDLSRNPLVLTQGINEQLGMLEGSRGAILLDPGFITFEKIANQLRDETLTPSGGSPHAFVTTFMQNNISTNLIGSLVDLALEYHRQFPVEGFTVDDQAKLEAFKKELNIPVTDRAALKKFVSSIGSLEVRENYTPEQMLMIALFGNVILPSAWGGYAFDKDGSVARNSKGNPKLMLKNRAITYASSKVKGGYQSSFIQFNIYEFMKTIEYMSLYQENMIQGDTVVEDRIERENLMYRTLDYFLTSTTTEFKNGLKVLPVIAKQTGGRVDEKADLRLGDIDQTIPLELTASIKQFNPPIIYFKSTGANNDVIWESPSDASEVIDNTSITTDTITIDFEGNSIDVDRLQNKQMMAKIMKELGVEESFSNLSREEGIVRIQEIGNTLSTELDGYGLDDVIQEYIQSLNDKLQAGELTSKSSTKYPNITLDNIMQSPAVLKLDLETRDNVQAFVDQLLLVNDLANTVLTSQDLSDAKALLKNISEEIAASDLSRPLKGMVSQLVNSTEIIYQNIELAGNLAGYSDAINTILADETPINLEFQFPGENASLTEKIIAYKSVPIGDSDYRTIRQAIKTSILNHDIPRYQLVLDLPMLSVGRLDELFTSLAGKGAKKYEAIVKDYTKRQAGLLDEVFKELQSPGSSTNPVVLALADSALILRETGTTAKIVNELTSSTLPNLFNIQNTLGLSTYTEPTLSNLHLDTLLLEQYKTALETLISDTRLEPTVDKQILKDTLNSYFSGETSKLNETYLGDRADLDTASILSEFLNRSITPKFFKDLVDGMIDTYGLDPTPENRLEVIDTLSSSVKDTFYYINGIPNSDGIAANGLYSTLLEVGLPLLNLDKTATEALSNTLKKSLITDPEIGSKIIC